MNEPIHSLVSDMKSSTADIGELVRTTTSHSTDSVIHAGAKARAALADVQARILAAQRAALGKARYQARAADDYVHDAPWRFIGAAVLVGAAIGFLLARR